MTATARRLPVGLTQWEAVLDVATNVATAVGLIARAAEDGAELVLLPENGLCLGTNAQMRAAALQSEGDEVGALRDAARDAGVVVVLGGFKRRDGDAVLNTALVIDAEGGIVGGYDKIHGFNARVGGQTFNAAAVERPGDRPVLVECAGVRIGLMICYDVRFPELARRLALEGAQVLLVPAAFTRATGPAHWEVLLRARAIENAAFVVASATVHGAAFATHGHAMVVDPWGVVLADLGEQAPACRVVELDLDEVDRVRDALPVLRGTRPEAYGAPMEILRTTREGRR